MSIIERTNPLNLQYRVCIVTSASSTLGTIICKTLLKANALVFGLDSRPKDGSLNAGQGTHFQFEECDLSDERTAERIVEAARAKFGLERLDVLVNVVEDGREEFGNGLKRLIQVVGKEMEMEGRGSVINVLGGAEGIDYTRDLVSQHQKYGIRCNIIVPRAVGEEDQQSSQAYRSAEVYMAALKKTEKVAKTMPSASESKQSAAKLFDIANLTLFLAGDMSENINGTVVRLGGSYRPL